MAVKQRTNKKGINLVLYFYVILILLLVLTVSSYTWFSLSKAPRVSNMTVYINMLAVWKFLWSRMMAVGDSSWLTWIW